MYLSAVGWQNSLYLVCECSAPLSKINPAGLNKNYLGKFNTPVVMKNYLQFDGAKVVPGMKFKTKKQKTPHKSK